MACSRMCARLEHICASGWKKFHRSLPFGVVAFCSALNFERRRRRFTRPCSTKRSSPALRAIRMFCDYCRRCASTTPRWICLWQPSKTSLATSVSEEEATLDYNWFDLIGNIGVLLMVVAYLLLQLEKLSSSALSYLLLNTVGAILVIISLMFRFNLSAFLMEAFWLLISLYGLAKPLFARTKRV